MCFQVIVRCFTKYWIRKAYKQLNDRQNHSTNGAFRYIAYNILLSLPLKLYTSLCFTVSETLPHVCESTTYVTTNDHDWHLLSNVAVKVIAQVIIVISFVGDICCIFRDIGPAEVSGSLNYRSLKLFQIALFDRQHITSYQSYH